MSLRNMDIVFTQGRGFDEQFAKGAIKELLEAVDFPQTEMQVVHTGIPLFPLIRRFRMLIGNGLQISTEVTFFLELKTKPFSIR